METEIYNIGETYKDLEIRPAYQGMIMTEYSDAHYIPRPPSDYHTRG